MSKHDKLTNRQMIELLVDQVQQVYVLYQQIYVAVTDMGQRLTALEIKVDYLADRQNEMFLELKSHNSQFDNHELRISKLETI